MSIRIVKGYRLKPCPCGNKNVCLVGQTSGKEDGFSKYYIICTNPMCHWTFNFTDTENTEGWLKPSKEAQTNVVNAWNNRK